MGLDELDRETPDSASVEATVENAAILSDLWELLGQIIEGERERIVAKEMWEEGLEPPQIYARHPDLFVDEDEVRQIRRNIVRRLDRKLTNDARAGLLRQELEHLFRG